jgi:hypothetical protein
MHIAGETLQMGSVEGLEMGSDDSG